MMTENRKAFLLFCLLAGLPAFLVLAALRFARLPWPVVGAGALATWMLVLLVFCAVYVGSAEEAAYEEAALLTVAEMRRLRPYSADDIRDSIARQRCGAVGDTDFDLAVRPC